ncbi:hypothetical protein [Clostridium rectalis]|uniref:hypothetical protein n=1 Tax=Clostridium rectalis TaxID=2040295 RepID=UPI000F640912|nr:hypothetical protein [Clostridium rectalis]
MKKAINLLGWFSVFITTMALILTILTTYQFVYVKYFNSYYTLQWCIFFTMSVWCIKFLDFKNNVRNRLYPVICMLFAVCAVFFIFMKVY